MTASQNNDHKSPLFPRGGEAGTMTFVCDGAFAGPAPRPADDAASQKLKRQIEELGIRFGDESSSTWIRKDKETED